MHSERRLNLDGKHVAVAISYAAIYQLMYFAMEPYWIVTAGLRMSCLLFVPRRYWSALVAGEMIPILVKTISHAHKFGALWALTSSIPAILVFMGVFTLLLRYMPLLDRLGRVRIDTVLGVALVSSLAMMVEIYVSSLPGYLSCPEPIKKSLEGLVPRALGAVIGTYLGVLTVAPMAIVLHEARRNHRRVAHWRPLLHDAFLLIAPYLAIVVAMAKTDSIEGSGFAQLAVMLPVVSLSANHGKAGAAMGAMLSSIAMHCIFNTVDDPAMLRAEGMLALVITGALVATRPSRPIRTFGSYSPSWTRDRRAFSYFERGLGWARRFQKIGAEGVALSVLLVVITATCMVNPTGGPATLYAQTFLTIGISTAWVVVNLVRGNARPAQCEPGRSARIRQAPQRA